MYIHYKNKNVYITMKCIITLEIGSENRVLVEVFDIF